MTAIPTYPTGDCHVGHCRRPADHRGMHGEPTAREAQVASRGATHTKAPDPFADAPWYTGSPR